MALNGAPRCPSCGADLDWGEEQCPYCGSPLLPRQPILPVRLTQGPFPWRLRVERRGGWRTRHDLFGDDTLLGRFHHRWAGGVVFLTPQGYLYRTQRGLSLRLSLLWICGGEVVAWVEQPRLWRRQLRIGYGSVDYRLGSASSLSSTYRLQDEQDALLLQIQRGARFRAPAVLLHGPLPLELLALAYATTLVL